MAKSHQSLNRCFTGEVRPPVERRRHFSDASAHLNAGYFWYYMFSYTKHVAHSNFVRPHPHIDPKAQLPRMQRQVSAFFLAYGFSFLRFSRERYRSICFSISIFEFAIYPISYPFLSYTRLCLSVQHPLISIVVVTTTYL